MYKVNRANEMSLGLVEQSHVSFSYGILYVS